VNLDLRIACPAERPRHAFRRVGLGDARDVGDEVHRLSIAEPLDLPPGERRGMIRPHDMGLLEALDEKPGLVVDRQAERPPDKPHVPAAKERFGCGEQRLEHGGIVDRVDEAEKAARVFELLQMRGFNRGDDPADRLPVQERDEGLHNILAPEGRAPRIEDHTDFVMERFDPVRVCRLRAPSCCDEGRHSRAIVDRNDPQCAHDASARRTSAAGEAALTVASSSATA